MKKRISLSLKDCSLIPMDLPPLKKKDTRLAVTAQLPYRYPHSLDGTVQDIMKRGDQTLVFLIKKEYLEQIRQNPGSRVEINCTAQFLPSPDAPACNRADKNTPWICRWSDSDGQDLFFLRGNRLVEAVRAASGRSIASLTGSFFSGEKPEILELSETRVSPLFSVKKRAPLPMLISCLPLAVIPFLLILLFLNNRTLTRELAEQKSTLKLNVLKSEMAGTDNYPWDRVHTLLSAHIPYDYYALFDALYPSFQNRGEILSLRIEGTELSLEAVGNEGLLIMEDLEKRGILTSLTLNQIREEKGREIISLSGSLAGGVK